MGTITPGKSLDDVEMKRIHSGKAKIESTVKHYMSERERLMCEAYDKHFGADKWEPETIGGRVSTKIYPDRTEFYADGKMILKLGKLKMMS